MASQESRIVGWLRSWKDRKILAERLSLVLVGITVFGLFSRYQLTGARIDASAALIDNSTGPESEAVWASILASFMRQEDRGRLYDMIRGELKRMGESDSVLDSALNKRGAFQKDADLPLVRESVPDNDPLVKKAGLAYFLHASNAMKNNEFFMNATPPRGLLFFTAKNTGKQDAERFTVTVQVDGRLRDVSASSDNGMPDVKRSGRLIQAATPYLAPGASFSLAVWLDPLDGRTGVGKVSCTWKDNSLSVDPLIMTPPATD